MDVQWNEDDDSITENVLDSRRKLQGRLSCVGIISTVTDEYLDWLTKYYEVEGMWARPLSFMRCHIFLTGQDENGKEYRVPRMVTSARLVELGVGAPLHPFFKEILEWFDLAPLQLSPNSYKLVIGMYMLYKELGYEAPTMPEVSYVFSLRSCGKGYYFLVIHPRHKKSFSEGKISHDKRWMDSYFYLYDVERIRTQFNAKSRKDAPLLFSLF